MKIYLRTLIKGVCWELIGILVMFLACLLTNTEYKIIFWYFLVRVSLYYPYHRLFKRVKFKKEIKLKIK